MSTRLNNLNEINNRPGMCCKPTDRMWRQFRDQARITSKHLQDEIFQSHYVPGVFSAEIFLHLLKQLLIVAPMKYNTSLEYRIALIYRGSLISRICNRSRNLFN